MPHGYFGWLDMESPGSSAIQKIKTPGVGDWFPSCRLMLLNYRQDRKYLGITHDSRAFSLEDVGSDYLLIEFYNELCLECVKEVETFKSLFQLLMEKPQWGERVRMIGIGAGSKKRNVARFRKQKKISFPLCADEKWELFKCLGNPTLPVSYLLKREGSRQKILMVHFGHVAGGDKLLQMIISAIKTEIRL